MLDGKPWKPYLLVSLVVPAAIIFALYLMTDMSLLGLAVGILLTYTFFPLLMMGIYMWATGSGGRWINGVDWTKLSESGRVQGAKMMGLSLFVSMLIIMLGMAVFFISVENSSIGFMVGISILIASVIVCMVPLFYGIFKISRKDFDEKWKHQASKAPSKGAILALIAVSIIVTIPVSYSFSEIGGDGNGITATLNDEDFSVKGPMFDHTFSYSDVTTFYLDENFDKGERRSGYGTSTIKSGNFRNSQFGDYQLASYAKVSPCIVIMVGGEYYAFNQSSDSATQTLYQELSQKILI